MHICSKVFLYVILFEAGYCTVASYHSCNRACDGNKPMTCEYHFTVENYYILSKACHLCPFNKTDCFRPHCVSANGHQRTILTVNRQVPGPSIEVCHGDTVRIWVENKMEDGSSTSIHWHGLKQSNTCHMDGVAMLTQCSISPYEIFRYEFLAEPAGSHWYHSHTGLQQGDGLFGALIIREQKSHDPNGGLYMDDLSDHVMVINDWLDVTMFDRYLKEMHDMFTADIPIHALVNGRGENHKVKDTFNLTGSAISPEPTLTPLEVFNVDYGKSYRFRMISAAPRCYFKVSIDLHNLIVIATDGAPLKPVEVQSIMIYPAERYDFVLRADKTPANYWIKLKGLGDCKMNNGNGYAILHYNGYHGNERPPGDPTDFSTQNGIVLNPLEWEPYSENDILLRSLRYGGSEENFENEKVDVRYHINLAYLQNDNTRYNDPKYYSVHSLPSVRSHVTPTLNNVVELFVVSYTADPHPLHLHGQRFRVVGDGMIPPKLGTMSTDEINEVDKTGMFPLILTNPLHKDTLAIQGKGSYSIIRFKATNPGIWFFHCHIDEHLMQGMALLIKIGKPEDFPKPPSYLSRCGGWKYQQEVTSNQTLQNTQNNVVPFFLISVIVLLVLILIFVVILLVKTFRTSSKNGGYVRVRS